MTTPEQQAAEAQAKDATPKRSREETLALLRKQVRKDMTNLTEVAKAYHQVYPIATTLPEVVDAVTVALPLRTFMVLAAIATTLVAIDMEKEAAEAIATASAGAAA